tara:strand:+ start:831 stop:1715 length:885 start_codon:yes stop_codon:yes gene_type:complete
MGLGEVKESKGTYLSIAGGYVWNRKIKEGEPNFNTQTYTRADKTEGTRQGGRYADLSGLITGVEFKTHDEYGESLNVTVLADGDTYIVSIATNNRYSQDFMKALLKVDLSKDIYFKPYDFVDGDGRRAQGIVFRQEGEKIALRNDDAPSKEKDWFKTSSKKEVKRFFEDLSDWFVAEVEEHVVPKLGNIVPAEKTGLGVSTDNNTSSDEREEISEAKTEDAKVAVALSPLKMKKALKVYIAENYEDEELPKLSKEDLKVWYDLSLAEEELPFSEGDSSEVSGGDLDDQLKNLLG